MTGETTEDSKVKKIRIVSPAKSIHPEILDHAKFWLIDQGFDVEIAPNATGEHHYFSGTDANRLKDFQDALDDGSLDAILCARGGYGSVRIVDQLNYSKFVKHPKLILGYSDVTVFHNRMNQMGFPSGHTTAPLNFRENTVEALTSLCKLIKGEERHYIFDRHDLNKEGEVSAEVVGGNLSIVASLVGTNDDLNMNGKILFLEEVGEAIYAIDRMFYTLKKSGKLRQLAGLMIGGMTGLKDSAVPFGWTVEEVIADHVKDCDYPLCFNFPAGHVDDNRAIILGEKARLIVGPEGSSFTQ